MVAVLMCDEVERERLLELFLGGRTDKFAIWCAVLMPQAFTQKVGRAGKAASSFMHGPRFFLEARLR